MGRHLTSLSIGDDTMSRMKCEAWRWQRDEDGWLFRQLLKRDALLPRTHGPADCHVGTGLHAFIEGNRIYCRNSKQRVRIDRGLPSDTPMLLAMDADYVKPEPLDARKVEQLRWEEKKGGRAGHSQGQGLYALQWYQEGGKFHARTEHYMINSGGSGPFYEVEGVTSRHDLILLFMRRVIKSCAHDFAGRHCSDGPAKWAQAQKKAAWAIGQCPPLMYGVDLAQEFEELKATLDANEIERCKMLHDVSDMRDKIFSAMYDAEGRDLPEHMSDWFKNTYGSDDDIFARADIQLQGEWPNDLRVMIYSAGPHYQGAIENEDTPEQLEAWRVALSERLPIP
ncbi:hypothetical protein DAPPUDRAFT_124286, partial [Daphnia pulex]